MDQFKFFQEKPLFVTLDGHKIYSNERFVSVNKYDLHRGEKTLPALTIVDRWPVPKRFAENFKVDDTLVYFKYRKNAEKYVKLNKQNQ